MSTTVTTARTTGLSSPHYRNSGLYSLVPNPSWRTAGFGTAVNPSASASATKQQQQQVSSVQQKLIKEILASQQPSQSPTATGALASVMPSKIASASMNSRASSPHHFHQQSTSAISRSSRTASPLLNTVKGHSSGTSSPALPHSAAAVLSQQHQAHPLPAALLMGATDLTNSAPSGFRLTPMEATIIQALRHKHLQVVANNPAVVGAPASPMNVQSSRTSSPTPTSAPNSASSSPTRRAPLLPHSREADTPLTEEEKEILSRPLNPPSFDHQTDILRHGPGPNDVLLGRGGKTNMHSGNMKFRQVVFVRQELYRSVPKYDKIWIAQNVVSKIQEQGGRFLRLELIKHGNGTKKVWVEVPQKKAIEKASQALRERGNGERKGQFQKAKKQSLNKKSDS